MPAIKQTKQATPLHPASARKIRKIVLEWGSKNHKSFPWRKPDRLWQALIAEILLQRTRASNVVPVYLKFRKEFPTVEALSSASVKRIERIIQPLGLRWRAPLLKKLGQRLAETKGRIKRSTAYLTSLPGVGPYAASAWLSFHGNTRAVIVDANVVRWLCRLTGRKYDGETRRKTWLIQLATYMTPQHNWKAYNYAILDFAMEICTQQPACGICPIGPLYCLYARKRRPSQ